MRHLVLSLILSLVFAPTLASASNITCINGEQSQSGTPLEIKYKFPGCPLYTQDDQHIYCPVLGAYLRQNNGSWKEAPIEVDWINVDPNQVEAWAFVTFPEYGKYDLVLSYTPFVYSAVVVEASFQGQKQVVEFKMQPEPKKAAIVRIPANQPNENETNELEITFPSAIDSADPYTDAATWNKFIDQWEVSIFCFNQPEITAFVANQSGCFSGLVNLDLSEPYLQLKACTNN